MQYLERAFGAVDVQLVARAGLEGAAPVGSDLRRDTERAQKTEGATRDRRVGDVEVNRDFAAPFEVHAAGGMKEPRQLGQSIALTPRRDRRELVPQVLRK